MTRRKLFWLSGLLILCLSVPAFGGTKWVKIDGPITAQEPQTIIDRNNAQQFSFSVHIPSFWMTDRELAGKQWQDIGFFNAARHSYPGEPAVPVLSRWIAVPQGASVSVKVTPGEVRVEHGVNCLPAQAPAADCYGEPEPVFEMNTEIYKADEAFPGKLYEVEGPYTIRGLRMMLLRLYPVQVQPASGRATIIADLEVAIDFHGSKGTFFTNRRGRSFQALYNQSFNRLAFRNEPLPVLTGKSPNGAEFVILTAPDFVDAAQDLADWKILQGYDTEVYTTDDSGTSISQIKAWVQNAYDTWDPAPEFILFFGDAEFISPTYDNPSIGSDLYYVTVDGDDEWADISHARISVDTAAEAQKHVEDIILYERYPIVDPNYYTNSYHAAYFQHAGGGYAERRFCRTSEETYQWFNQYMTNSPFTPHRIYFTEASVNPRYWNQSTYAWTPVWWTYSDVDIVPELLRESGFAWNGDDEDIAAAVNAGTAFITHRDHGDTDGWSEPAFNTDQVLALTNGDKLPVVWSINCLTGYFDNETKGEGDASVCFTEGWERNPNGGAVGVLGSTRVSYSGRNDRMFWGWLDSMWPEFEPEYPEGSANEPEWRMSTVMDYGKMYMSYHYPDDPYRMDAIEEFHWFGDPTMEMWAGNPGTMTVETIPVVPVGSTSFDVGVNVDGALAAMSQNGVILGKAYSSMGNAHIEFDAPVTTIEDITLVVTRRNYRPYEDTLMVGATEDGIVGLNRSAYAEWDTVTITLSDADLLDLGTYTLSITSDTEADGEDVALTEIVIGEAGTGTFLGDILLTTGPSANDGKLSVANGDTVTIRYWDENIGSGSGAWKTDTAIADTAAPTFGGITSLDCDDAVAVLSWNAASDLTPPITYYIYRAETSGGQNFNEPVGQTTETTFTDTGLQNFVYYYYVVRAADAFGHQDANTTELFDQTIGPVVVWEEDFDDKSGIPEDWESEDNANTNCTWADDNPGGRSSDYWNGVFAIADADDCGMFSSWDDALITNVIDLVGYTETELVFSHEYGAGSGLLSGHAMIDVSTDGGESWFSLVDWRDSRDGVESVDLSDYADYKDNVKLRFTYQSGNFGEWWGIDNLQVIGVPDTDAPTADFSATPVNGELPLSVTFAPITTGGVTSYVWEFGDGEYSQEDRPTHIYTDSGTFDVSLTVTGPYGSDTMVKQAFVTTTCANPDLEFTADVTTGQTPLSVQFTDQTENYGGCEPTGITWEFGDGGTATDTTNPVYVYENPGIFTVTLTYIVDYGSGEISESHVAMIYVTCGPPQTDFSADVIEGDAPLTVQLSDASLVGEGCEISKWVWAYGLDENNMTVVSGQNPLIILEEPGIYAVALEATNEAGSDREIKTGFINVKDPDADDDDDDDDNDVSPDDDDSPSDDDAGDDDDTGNSDAGGDDDDDDDSCGCS